MAYRVFIAGPVQRPKGPQVLGWIQHCYNCIEMAADELGLEAKRPAGELGLEEADRNTFRLEIRRRIRHSVAVIGLFLPNDPSVPAEVSIAAEHNKPVLLIHQAETRIPRILPGQTLVEDPDEDRMTERIAHFLRRFARVEI